MVSAKVLVRLLLPLLLQLAASATEDEPCSAALGTCPAAGQTHGGVFIQMRGVGKLEKLQHAKLEPWLLGPEVTDDSVHGMSDGLGGGGGLHRCCERCGKYCSPQSYNCYDGRYKHYYEFCDVPDLASVTLGNLVWADEFDGSGKPDSSKWTYEILDRPFNNELQVYTDRIDNAHQENGILKVAAKCENFHGQDFTSARLITKGKASWGPGHRVEVRARAPTSKGVWPAIWMMPNEDRYGAWPASGEIDIMEAVGCTAGEVYGTVHTKAYNHVLGTQKGGDLAVDFGAWHTYTIDWLDSQIKWFVDGEHYHTFFAEPDGIERWPFTSDFYLILNVAVGGHWGGYCLHGPPSCGAWEFGHEQVMEVDYARVYAISSK
eukprot:TRINITY_DN3050_c0_g1_i1.p1 TRINITY_DN3050_c0_g1~~TRINITY_DN3050_c0_g1_i1.p1  ORF type:complete len:395 (-),score=58.15 TRINITY_DN3050_c0_g1_i1:505-1632(-)